MTFADYLQAARRTFVGRPARTLLTLVGIIIGSGTIVLLAGLLQGGEQMLMRANQAADNKDLIQITPKAPPHKQERETSRALGREDALMLRQSPLLHDPMVATESVRETSARVGSKTKRISIVGAEPVARQLYRLEVERGRFLDEDDVAEGRRVCVVGHEVWSELIDTGADEVRFLEVDGRPWTVVGVLRDKPPLGGATVGDITTIWNRKVIVPTTTFDSVYAPDHRVARLFLRVGGLQEMATRMAGMRKLVQSTLLRRHLGVQNFQLDRRAQDQDSGKLILLVVRMLLFGAGIVSLFVGGINIMNIMLVTVTERTREIGVRRAVGATPFQILGLFLVESTAMAAVGGALGVLLGILLTGVGTLLLRLQFGNWQMFVVPWSLGLGFGAALVVGVVFGLIPAWRAARLQPVEALRSD